MVGVTDNVVAVAGLSGAINAIHFNPNRHLGIIGAHVISDGDAEVAAAEEEEDTGDAAGSSRNGAVTSTTTAASSRAPIDSLSLNHDGNILASLADSFFPPDS